MSHREWLSKELRTGKAALATREPISLRSQDRKIYLALAAINPARTNCCPSQREFHCWKSKGRTQVKGKVMAIFDYSGERVVQIYFPEGKSLYQDLRFASETLREGDTVTLVVVAAQANGV